MTLATTPRYEPGRLGDIGDRAVVAGGSMAGLMTARVLADGFREVTVLERDPLPDEPVPRRGVPQGRHVHLMLEAGRATLDDLFPGYSEELVSEGGLIIDALTDFVHYEQGDFLVDVTTCLPTYCATRPLFEQVVRRRVADRDGVELRAGCQCTDYLVDDGTTVSGVRVRDDSGEEELPADLLVDATGRTSTTPTVLEDHGYEPPAVDEVHVDVAYSTVVVDRPPEDRRLLFVPPEPPRTRGAGVFPAEDGRWLVTLFGLHGDHPPTEADGLREFAASIPGPDLAGLLDARPWLSDEIAHYPFPSSRRRRYEELDRFPDGLVVLGDAIASFNPIYGQGMSVAALETLLLHDELATGGRDDLALRFFDRAEETIDVAWDIAVGGDFAFPQTTGAKPRGTAVINRYMDRLVRKAHTDGTLREALYRVFNMELPPSSLLRPGLAWRVLRPTWPGGGSARPPASQHRSEETP